MTCKKSYKSERASRVLPTLFGARTRPPLLEEDTQVSMLCDRILTPVYCSRFSTKDMNVYTATMTIILFTTTSVPESTLRLTTFVVLFFLSRIQVLTRQSVHRTKCNRNGNDETLVICTRQLLSTRYPLSS